MSYDIRLVNPSVIRTMEIDGREVKFALHAVGKFELNLTVTYNYAHHLRRVLDEKGLRSLYGMTGDESIPVLQKAIEQLGDDVTEDYWEATEGNTKAALIELLTMAAMLPDGIWAGD